jgi:hypothetical protein
LARYFDISVTSEIEYLAYVTLVIFFAAYGYQQNPDIQQQFQQQQSLMMNQCLQQMCMQQLEVQNMQRQLAMFTDPSYYGGDLRLRSLQSLPTDSRNLSPNLESRQQPFSVQPQFPPSFYSRRSNDNSPQMNSESLLRPYSQAKKTSSGRNKNAYEQYLAPEKKDPGRTPIEEESTHLTLEEFRNRRP